MGPTLATLSLRRILSLEKAMCRGSSCIHIAGVTIGYFDFDWKWYEMVSSSVWNYLQYPFLFVCFFPSQTGNFSACFALFWETCSEKISNAQFFSWCLELVHWHSTYLVQPMDIKFFSWKVHGFLVMIPSGKHTKNLWKITMLLMGKLTIPMAIFSTWLYVYQRIIGWWS